MTRFMDGPAAGATLMLRRRPLPVFLRIVVDPKGKVDALDMLDDEADELETIHVYIRVGKADGWMHLNMGRKAGGGIFSTGEYTFYSTPADELVRENSAWKEWTLAEWEKVKNQPET